MRSIIRRCSSERLGGVVFEAWVGAGVSVEVGVGSVGGAVAVGAGAVVSVDVAAGCGEEAVASADVAW